MSEATGTIDGATRLARPDPPGDAAFRRWSFALVAVEAIALLVAGFSAASLHRPWSPVDEAAHFHFVRVVAEQRRLPRLGDPMSDDILAIVDRTYPGPPLEPPDGRGLVGRSWEAFQPPLGYLLAVPAYLAAPAETLAQVRAVRCLGVVLHLLAMAVTCAFARDVAGRDWPAAAAFAGLFLIVPGVLFRSAIVSNEAAAVLLATTAAWLLWRSIERPDRTGRFLLASFAVGLCLLTKLTLAWLCLVWAAVALRRLARVPTGGALAAVAAGAGLLVLPLLPWILRNLAIGGTPTMNAQARRMQEHIVNPLGARFGIRDALSRWRPLATYLLPQEAGGYAPILPPRWTRRWLPAALLVPPGIGALAAFRTGRAAAAAFAAMPLVLAWSLVVLSSALADWDMVLPRYLHAALPAFGLLPGIAAAGRVRALRLLAAVTTFLLAAVLVLWGELLHLWLGAPA